MAFNFLTRTGRSGRILSCEKDFNEILPYKEDDEIIHFEDQQLVHQPVLIAVDSSSSMKNRETLSGRENIELANDLLVQIGSDPDFTEADKKTTDICLMSFSNGVTEILSWQPLSLYEGSAHIYAHGSTALHSTVCKALEAVHDLKASYALSGIQCKRPQIFIFTDGYSTDSADVREKAREMCRKYVDSKKVTLNFILLPGSGTEDAKELSPMVKLYRAEDCTHGLPACAEFINASIVAFSSSAPGSEAEVPLPKWLKTTQPVKTDENGNRTVDVDVDVWN